MQITSLPLIIATVLATAGALTGTVLLWHRVRRGRALLRSAGILVCEALLVLSAGLVVNRQEDFYPSWQALAGDTGPAAATARRAAGSLDAAFGPGTLRVAWQPPGSAAWRLRSAAQLTVPPRYVSTGDEFPALIALGGRPAPGDLVEVTAQPGPLTTGLADLPARLAADARVTGQGWVLVTAAAAAPLAVRLAGQEPGRFAALAVVGVPPSGLPCPPPGVAVAMTGRPAGPMPCAATRLPGSWAAATRWAVGQTALPLAPPQVLPTAVLP
jgi:hypothetical protein